MDYEDQLKIYIELFAPYAPADRIWPVFGKSRLGIVAPIIELQGKEYYDLSVIKLMRMYLMYFRLSVLFRFYAGLNCPYNFRSG